MPVIEKKVFERLYAKYNRRGFVHPDPLEFLYDYEDIRQREVVGIIASSIAYGNVMQILKSVSTVIERMVPSPAIFLKRSSLKTLRRAFGNFKHRFTTGQELAGMLFGIRCTIERYGSLQACFVKGMGSHDETILPALAFFVKELSGAGGMQQSFLLPSPIRKSACKRLNLFLRWMVRQDDVDPGGWSALRPSMLIVPVDTHMHRICRALNLTKRKRADLQAALEITSSFRSIVPEDPVRYDFVLTRLGIRADTDRETFLQQCKKSQSTRQ